MLSKRASFTEPQSAKCHTANCHEEPSNFNQRHAKPQPTCRSHRGHRGRQFSACTINECSSRQRLDVGSGQPQLTSTRSAHGSEQREVIGDEPAHSEVMFGI